MHILKKNFPHFIANFFNIVIKNALPFSVRGSRFWRDEARGSEFSGS